jgi:hypothetical protein
MRKFRLAYSAVIASAVLGGCSTLGEPATQNSRAVNPADQAALDLINKRIAAYNAHDMEAFLATYDEGVRIFSYPDRLLGVGRDRMRGIFGPQFARGEGKITVLGQHVLAGRVVSDEDNMIGTREDHAIAIYTLRDGLIAEVRLLETPR